MHWPCASLAFAVSLLLWCAAGRLEDDLRCDGFLAGNETCVLNRSRTFDSGFDASYDGNILFTNGARFTVRSGRLSIQASGTITLDKASALHVEGGNLAVTASTVAFLNKSSVSSNSQENNIMVVSREQQLHIGGGASVSGKGDIGLEGVGVYICNGASVAARGRIILGGSCEADEFEDTCNKSIAIDFAQVEGRSIDFCCRKSNIMVHSNSVVSTPDAHGSIQLHANWILLDTGSTVETTSLSVHAAASANLTGDLPGVTHIAPKLASAGMGMDNSTWPTANTQLPTSVNLSVLGQLVLGHSSELGHQVWNVQLLRAIADSILVERGLTISTNRNSSSCHNKESVIHDVCVDIRNGVPVDPGYGSNSNANLTYDLLLAAKEDLEILDNTNIKAASMMICAGRTTTINDGVVLDARGRGCVPGVGAGRGETREPYVGCGAGGGSHIGKGGMGAQYDSRNLDVCSSGGPRNDRFVPGLMPSQGASGGGCGVPQPCGSDYPMLHSDQHPSAGGGLIWLSTANLACIGKVTIVADGNAGIAVPYSETSLPMALVSGGGAGGQVLMFASKFRFSEAQEVIISAAGGNSFCNGDQASGGGGGGFVGLMWEGGTDINAEVSSTTKVRTDGGKIDPRCAARIPHVYEWRLYGEPGVAAPLAPCGPGLWGLFCSPCPVGTYKSEAEVDCQACANKPNDNAVYAGPEGWPNSTCPFQCAPSVPNINSNPHCMDAFQYALHFYGGVAGLLCVLAVLILVTIFLMCRRSSWAKRVFAHSSRDSESFLSEADHGQRGAGRRCFKKCRRCFKRRERSITGSTLKFTREQLPFHIGRVYLNGQNTSSSPWLIDDKVPTIVEQLVANPLWERFAGECNFLAKVHASEAYFEQILRFLYPAALPVYKCWRRHRRAKRLRRCAQSTSDGSEAASIWRPIRSGGMSRLVMIFGCDRGATLGYLDFFDFSRSQFDWAPVDLRREVRLLVAHGLGSYAEPLALDTGDPLVHNLAQNTFNSSAVFSVISTFNRISRLMPAVELDFSGTGRLMFSCLCEKVEQCAVKCGLAGCVQVLLVPQFNLTAQDVRASTNLDPPRASQTSFSDLIRQNSDGGRRDEFTSNVALHNSGTWEGLQSLPVQRVLEHGSTATGSNASQSRRKVAMRLCLAFFDRAAAEGSIRSSPSSATNTTINSIATVGHHSELPQPLGVALTSPMPHSAFADCMSWKPPHQSSFRPSALQALTSWIYTCRWRVTSCLLSVRLAVWSGRSAALAGTVSPPTVLLLFVLFYFADLMVFMLMGSIYLQLGPGIIALWILVPPLTQPLAVVIGPLFAFSERPRLGRLFASLILFSAMNAMVVTIVVIGVFREAWFFHFLELPMAFVVKAMLFICANVHIGNLEARHDLSFMDTPQADFLGNILSADDGTPTIPLSRSVISEKGLQGLQPLRVGPESPLVKVSPSPTHPWTAGMDVLPQAGNTRSDKGYVPSPF